MSQGTRLTAQMLPSQYPFDRFTTVADVGGGDGTLLAAILDAHQALHGILYDTEEGLAQAKPHPRIRPVTGDFFAWAPEGADLYLLKSVLHDWPDDRCVTILSHCRRAMPAEGRLLVVEPTRGREGLDFARHRGRIQVVFCDAHVESLPMGIPPHGGDGLKEIYVSRGISY